MSLLFIVCSFQANSNFIAVGSLKDVEEVDISRVLNPEPLLWADDEAEREQIDVQRRRYCLLILLRSQSITLNRPRKK